MTTNNKVSVKNNKVLTQKNKVATGCTRCFDCDVSVKSYQITVTGFTYCTTATPGNAIIVSGGDQVNGTFCLVRDPFNPCVYRCPMTAVVMHEAGQPGGPPLYTITSTEWVFSTVPGSTPAGTFPRRGTLALVARGTQDGITFNGYEFFYQAIHSPVSDSSQFLMDDTCGGTHTARDELPNPSCPRPAFSNLPPYGGGNVTLVAMDCVCMPVSGTGTGGTGTGGTGTGGTGTGGTGTGGTGTGGTGTGGTGTGGTGTGGTGTGGTGTGGTGTGGTGTGGTGTGGTGTGGTGTGGTGTGGTGTGGTGTGGTGTGGTGTGTQKTYCKFHCIFHCCDGTSQWGPVTPDADGPVCLTSPPSDFTTTWTMASYVPCNGGAANDSTWYIYTEVNGCVGRCSTPDPPSSNPGCDCPTAFGLDGSTILDTELTLSLGGLTNYVFGDGTLAYGSIADFITNTYQAGTSCDVGYVTGADFVVKLVNWFIDEVGIKSYAGGWYVKDKVYTLPDSSVVVDNEIVPMISVSIHKQDVGVMVPDPETEDCSVLSSPSISDTTCSTGAVLPILRNGSTHNAIQLNWSTDLCQWILHFFSLSFYGPKNSQNSRGAYYLTQGSDGVCPPDTTCNTFPSGGSCVFGALQIN